MPLLAAFIGTLAEGLVAAFSRFMSLEAAMRLAAFTAWTAVYVAFLGSVYVCMSSLYATVSGFFASAGTGGWGSIVSSFGMGLGMMIPSNAGAVIACTASVWIACQIYKIQRDGIHNYSK